MKKHLFSRMVVVGAVVVLMGFGVNAFAGMGKGPGNPGMGAASANLTDDQIKQMESERNAFQTATKDIRQQLNEKRQALQCGTGQTDSGCRNMPRPFKRKSPICRLSLTRSV